MQWHYVVTVDGKPTDIRGSYELAIRQADVRKADGDVVQVHYAAGDVITRHDGSRLIVDIVMQDLSNLTWLATR